jgi:hypothetical protein
VVLLAETGYDVHGVDLPERMVAAAKTKVIIADLSAQVPPTQTLFPQISGPPC